MLLDAQISFFSILFSTGPPLAILKWKIPQAEQQRRRWWALYWQPWAAAVREPPTPFFLISNPSNGTWGHWQDFKVLWRHCDDVDSRAHLSNWSQMGTHEKKKKWGPSGNYSFTSTWFLVPHNSNVLNKYFIVLFWGGGRGDGKLNALGLCKSCASDVHLN